MRKKLILGLTVVASLWAADWAPPSRLAAADGVAGDNFGTSVSISGNRAVVGWTGGAYIYRWDSGSWVEEAKLSTPAPPMLGAFEVAAISGDTVIMGDIRQGVFIYSLNAGAWSQQAQLLPDDGAGVFGTVVAISGDTALVGDYADHNYAGGVVYIYTRSGTTWTRQAKLKPSDSAYFDHFGQSLSIEGDTALIGAPYSGSAYVFTRSGGVWTEKAKLRAGDDVPANLFGSAVALSGTTAIVSAIGTVDAAYLFEGYGANWQQVVKIGPENPADVITVKLSGNLALIGWAPWDGPRIVEVYARHGSKWTKETTLTPPNPSESGAFSGSPAIDGSKVFVAAPTEADDTGAVYAYIAPCTLGMEVSYSGTALTIGYSFSSDDPIRWSAWLLHSTGTRRLWSTALGASDDKTGSFVVPNFPATGPAGVLSVISDASGPICWDSDGTMTTEAVKTAAQQNGIQLP